MHEIGRSARLRGVLLALGLALLLCACSRAPESKTPSIPKNEFRAEEFVPDGNRISYIGTRTAQFGIDVSAHQGQIDWAAVRQDGVEFAFLRIGYRGYSAGGIYPDERFAENLRGAQENGIAVGVYFFSQAISTAEAVEEAEFVLEMLDGAATELPIVLDWERVDSGRSANMDAATLNDCAAAFLRTVTQAGYSAALYFNQEFGYRMFRLSDYPDISFWLAEYDAYPSFAYAFTFWQYSNEGHVAGIETAVDLNLYFPPETADTAP